MIKRTSDQCKMYKYTLQAVHIKSANIYISLSECKCKNSRRIRTEQTVNRQIGSHSFNPPQTKGTSGEVEGLQCVNARGFWRHYYAASTHENTAEGKRQTRHRFATLPWRNAHLFLLTLQHPTPAPTTNLSRASVSNQAGTCIQLARTVCCLAADTGRAYRQ